MGLKNTAGRYKITTQGFIPRFDSSQRKFRNRASQPVASTSDPEQAGVPIVRVAPNLNDSEPSIDAGGERSIDSAQEDSVDGAMKTAEGKLNRTTSFFRNPFSFRSSVKLNRPLVQVEMNFGTLPVLRNDLNDSDVEVIPAPLKKKERSSGRTESARNPGLSWGGLANRLFEAGRSGV